MLHWIKETNSGEQHKHLSIKENDKERQNIRTN